MQPDRPAGDAFRDGSFQKHAYLCATQERLQAPDAARADADACRRWSLSPEQWAERMLAVARARAHDAKLDLLGQGVTPSA